jgi:hypothetical protein
MTGAFDPAVPSEKCPHILVECTQLQDHIGSNVLPQQEEEQ